MRIRTFLILGLSGLAISACGSGGGKAATKLRPPTPVNLTVYVNDSRISVSPTAVGAGPVVFIVTNQASRAEALAISPSGRSNPLASTAPINPQGTTQVTLTFKPGDYTIATAPHGQTDAQLSRPSNIAPAALHIGHQRASSSNSLLQP
ncbi:MAG: hypothetical protein ACR2NR_01935 [Solirubrobacteraceae bacterium]